MSSYYDNWLDSEYDNSFAHDELYKVMLITHIPTGKVTKCEFIIQYNNSNDIENFDYNKEFEFNIIDNAGYFDFTDKDLNNYSYEVI
jgi:hypothetical protein